MFQHGLKRVVNFSKYQQQRKLSISLICFNESSFNSNRQGKIMSKLFGQRLKGSKKRWYPTTDTTQTNTTGSAFIFKASQLSKPGGAGKNTTRRSAVLNKLFMEEISSLLATGGIAESFLGRGLQLTRVKIAPDFSCVNVYWLGQGDPITDGKLAEDLNHCSGILRHELSQLRVMGEVPRIYFVQDKTFANIEYVENLLRNIDISGEASEDTEENRIDFQNQSANRIKDEFYGSSGKAEIDTTSDAGESLPPMRHDVFGLDHRSITLKILTKMRKTKQAWEAHNVREASNEPNQLEDLPQLRNMPQKIMDVDGALSSDFDKFLAKRRERKNTPERKKYRRSDEISFASQDDFETDVIVSKELKDYLNQEDYLHEEFVDEKKS